MTVGTDPAGSGNYSGMPLSFDEAFAAEFSALHRYLARRVGVSVADDVAASTFAVAFARWDSFDQARAVRPWLYGIAANLVRRHWRDEQRKLRAYARSGVDPLVWDESDLVERVEASAQRRELAAALAQLRPVDRDVLLLHAWAELSDGEIAEALSLPVGTVKSKLHRARGRVRNYLAGTGQLATRPTRP